MNYDNISQKKLHRNPSSNSHKEDVFYKSSLDEININRDNMVFRSREGGNQVAGSHDGGSVLNSKHESLDHKSADEFMTQKPVRSS